jgi:hypothetical protein
MRTLLIAFLVLSCSLSSKAQELTVNLDYEVTYAIPAPRRNTTDTITVSFTKDGRYLHSNIPFLGKDLGRSILKDPTIDLSDSDANFVLDTGRMLFYFHFSFEDNIMFMKMNIENFIPVERDPLEGDLDLIAEATGDKMNLAGSNYPTFLLYPKNEPEEPVTLVMDTNRPVNNLNLINEFIKLMLRKTESKGSASFDIPNGLILGAYSTGGTLFEAISVKDINTTINIANGFNINR